MERKPRWEPTNSAPEAHIAEAREFVNDPYWSNKIRDEGPLPELYPGHYEDLMGLKKPEPPTATTRVPGPDRKRVEP